MRPTNRTTWILLFSFLGFVGLESPGCSNEVENVARNGTDPNLKGGCTPAMDDGDPCTLEGCEGQENAHVVTPGLPCGLNNDLVCTATGACGGCTDPSQCGVSTGCLPWVCDVDKICRQTPSPSNQPISTQIPKDCKKIVCDGMGGEKTINDDTDVPFYDCYLTTCSGGSEVKTPAAQGTAWGFVATTGETQGIVAPNWSHDGKTIVYTSAGKSQDGRIGDNVETDIKTVPYNNRQGGNATPLAGAATAGVSEYYPSFSADDKLVAYNRAGSTTGRIYYRPDGEIYVIPAEGGTPIRINANDPPACTGQTSPGIINSWAKWSPTVLDNVPNGKRYYWLIFSSARDYPGAFIVPPNQYSPPDTRASQLYMTAIVKDAQGNLETYPAVYIWNQDGKTSNLTPAWDIFDIPPPPPPK